MTHGTPKYPQSVEDRLMTKSYLICLSLNKQKAVGLLQKITRSAAKLAQVVQSEIVRRKHVQ